MSSSFSPKINRWIKIPRCDSIRFNLSIYIYMLHSLFESLWVFVMHINAMNKSLIYLCLQLLVNCIFRIRRQLRWYYCIHICFICKCHFFFIFYCCHIYFGLFLRQIEYCLNRTFERHCILVMTNICH